MTKTYTIGQVAKNLGIPSSTLRYYDKLNLFPKLQKSGSGIRYFTSEDVDTIRVIECLKKANLSIKEIQYFTKFVAEGDASIHQRRQLFYKVRQNFIEELHQMQQTLDVLDFKCRYYDQAIEDGTEKHVQKSMPLSEVLPESSIK